MVGDLIIIIKHFFKQTFCIHEYEKQTRLIGNDCRKSYTCKKCGRIVCK